MGKPKAPEPPDPKETAQAQTGTNLATAQANAALGNVNQITPYGSLTYSTTGQQFISDPNGAKWYRGPDGTYTQSRPQAAPMASSQVQRPVGSGNRRGVGVQNNSAGNPAFAQPTGRGGYNIVSGSSLPEGWEEMTGYYVPTYTAEQSLSPGQQAIFDQTQGAQLNLATLAKDQSARLQQLLGTPFTLDGLPAAGVAPDLATSYVDDFSVDRKRVEDALMQRLAPSLEAQSADARANLLNQGLRAGSTAYDRGIDEVNRTATDARLATILAGGEEQSRLADLSRNQAIFGNTAKQQNFQNVNAVRNQALQEQFALRNQPLNEISALLSGSQIRDPNFVNANMPNIPTVDYAGLVNENYNQKLGAYNQQMQNSQGIMGGLFGLGSSLIKALPFSDRRVKQDIKRIGTADNGLAIYSYRYAWGGPVQIGFMADEVAKIRPDAVVTDETGFNRVDYERAVI